MFADLDTYDIEFLSILAGDETTYKGGWGAWMTACGEYTRSKGYAKGCYEITDRGLAVLEALSKGEEE